MKIVITFNNQEKEKFNDYVKVITESDYLKINNKQQHFIGKFGQLKSNPNKIVYDLKSEMITEMMDIMIGFINMIKPFFINYMKFIESWFEDTNLQKQKFKKKIFLQNK